MSFHTASAVPDRIGAVASFHGGGLVNDARGPTSPHLFGAATTKASFLIAIAENDDKQRPNNKTVLKETFDKAKLAGREIRGLFGRPWLVPAGYAGLQRKSGGAGINRLLALYVKALA